MTKRHWRVEVYLDGSKILAIDPESVCVVDNMQEYEEEAIRAALNKLLRFIGEPTK